MTMNFDKKLSELEMRALCRFVMNPDNNCKIILEKSDKSFMGEGLLQTLYFFEDSSEYVFIAIQKGYIVDAVLIKADEIETFKSLWRQDMLTPYGHIKS